MNDVLARIPVQAVPGPRRGTGTPAAPARVPCTAGDPELWFAESPSDLETAKALCAPCPLRASCLSGALLRREPYGVWGGQLLIAGVVVARKRPRGRPRKDTVAA